MCAESLQFGVAVRGIARGLPELRKDRSDLFTASSKRRLQGIQVGENGFPARTEGLQVDFPLIDVGHHCRRGDRSRSGQNALTFGDARCHG